MTVRLTQFYTLLFFLVAFVSACVDEEFPGYSVTESDIYYQTLATDGNDRKPIAGDYLTLDVKYKTLSDSIFYDASKESRDGRMTLVVPDSIVPGSYHDALCTLHEGDSANLLIDVKSFFVDYQKQEIPPFASGDPKVKISVRLEKVRNSVEVMADEEKAREELLRREMEEQRLLAQYVSENALDSNLYRGMYIIVEDSGTGVRSEPGRLVSFHFTGTFLDGKKFDSTYDRNAPLDFTIGHPGIVIKGLEVGLKTLRSGARAKFIIPSHLAFGSRGVPGVVPPFTTLVYEVELIKSE